MLSATATYAAFAVQHAAKFPGKPLPLRPVLLAAAVALWGVRLGGFLFNRILQSPEDKRLSTFQPAILNPHIWTLDQSPQSQPLNPKP